jgi:alkaline phosphatase D
MADPPGCATPSGADPTAMARRTFLTGAAGLLTAAAIPGVWAASARTFEDPFTLGVASGDPTPTGVVLWTRLAPRPLEPDGGMPGRAVPVHARRRVRTLARFVVEDGRPGADRVG